MTDDTINCPNCGTEIPVSEVLAHRIRENLRGELERGLDKRIEAAAAKARDEHKLVLHDLRARLAEQEERTEHAERQELALRKRSRALEARERNVELDVQRRIEKERAAIREAEQRRAGDEQTLKLKEKDKQIADLEKLLDEARRKSRQGSQETQGEVLELDLEAALSSGFPQDEVRPVPKGMRGADLLHEVRDAALRPCGTIIWEAKNTRNWSPAWLDKLKDDQRACGANLAVLVSVALPPTVRSFAQVDGVWVASYDTYLALAAALREQLVRVDFARNAAEGLSHKMDMLYRYLAGDEFRLRVEAIVECFTAMQAQLHRERRAMEKQWREREKQIERMMLSTTGLYGDLRGIVGTSMPEIDALELDDAKLLAELPE